MLLLLFQYFDAGAEEAVVAIRYLTARLHSIELTSKEHSTELTSKRHSIELTSEDR